MRVVDARDIRPRQLGFRDEQINNELCILVNSTVNELRLSKMPRG